MKDAHDQPSQADLDQLIQALGRHLTHFGPKSFEEVQKLSMMFGIRLPTEYVWFLKRYGALAGEAVKILGIADAKRADLAIENITLLLRLGYAKMPLDIVPIEDLGNGLFAGLVCPARDGKPSPIVLLDMMNPDDDPKKTPLASGFVEYIYNRLILQLEPLTHSVTGQTEHEHGLAVLKSHAQQYNKKFHYEHKTGGRLPKNEDWRPYRYCIQDVMFGATVVRHFPEGNCLLVDVFLTANVPEYGPLAGAKALTAFLLSEAYKCGGTMEIRFTREVEGGQIPRELKQLALQYGIQFRNNTKPIIEPSEAKALYVALTGFSPELAIQIKMLEKRGKVKLARACYVVHHGVWSKEQLEMIVLGSENPGSILGGEATAENRHQYQHDLLHARAAILADMFERIIVQQQRETDEGIQFDLEDDVKPLETSFDENLYMKKYRSTEDVGLKWLLGAKKNAKIKANLPFQVLIRARDGGDLYFHLSEDIKTAEIARKKHKTATFLLVPSDFQDLPTTWTEKMKKKLQEEQVGLLVCPENTSTLDTDAAQRMAKSRVLRK